jgi:hypothetical protein
MVETWNPILLILSWFLDAKVRAHTGKARITQDSPEFGASVFAYAGEPGA